jgi:hypothetical protein
MAWDSVLLVVALLIQLGAFCFVVIQSTQNNKELRISVEENTRERRAMVLEELPLSYLVVAVQHQLSRWSGHLEELINNEISIRNDLQMGSQEISKRYGLISPKGLLDNNLYGACPHWLQIIYESRAQYSYDVFAIGSSLKPQDHFSLVLLTNMIERAKENLSMVTEI